MPALILERRCIASLVLAAVFLASNLWAHPVVKGNFEIQVASECVHFTATVSMEEVLLASTLGTDVVPGSMDEAIQRHGQYILKHVSLFADENPLLGTVHASAIVKDGVERVKFQLEFRPDKTEAIADAQKIRVEQRMLNDVKAPAGDAWEAAYILSIGMKNGARAEGLLARDKPVTFNCVWNQPHATSSAPSTGSNLLFPALFIAGTFLVLVILARMLERRKKA